MALTWRTDLSVSPPARAFLDLALEWINNGALPARQTDTRSRCAHVELENRVPPIVVLTAEIFAFAAETLH